MSKTIAIGVYRASHWISVCAKVVEYLDYLLGTYKNMQKVEVPTNVITSLQGLLSSALLATMDGVMPNPQASINDFLILQKAMRGAGVQKLGRRDLKLIIEEYLSLLDRLKQPHEMKDLPQDLVVKMRIFFHTLQKQGESDRFFQRMRESHPYNHL